MPSYDYECQACGYVFEAFHSMSTKLPIDCPKCGKPKLIRLISGGGAVIVKGTKTPCRGELKPKKKLKKLGEEKVEPPLWRSSPDGKVRKDILKNPDKYVRTGEV